MQQPTLSPLRKILLFFVLIIAACAAFFFTYEKDKDVVAPANQTQVKGTQVVNAETPATDIYTESEASKKMDLTSDNVIWFTNYYRVENGLAPLTTNPMLEASAKAKTADMFEYQYFDHTRPGKNAVAFNYFITAQKYNFIKAGENLAEGGFTTSKEVVDAWMQSPEHKKNILDTGYKDIGVAVESGTLQGKSTTLITEHFGEAASACPSISQATKTALDTLKTQLATIQGNINTQQKVLGSDDSAIDPNYDTLVDDYNALVKSYNDSVTKLSDLVAIYNEQVKVFDQCLGKS